MQLPGPRAGLAPRLLTAALVLVRTTACGMLRPKSSSSSLTRASASGPISASSGGLHRDNDQIGLRHGPADQLRCDPFQVNHDNPAIAIRRADRRNDLRAPHIRVQRGPLGQPMRGPTGQGFVGVTIQDDDLNPYAGEFGCQQDGAG